MDLGKYPELRVTGDAVTPEQAEEIILATTSWADLALYCPVPWLNTVAGYRVHLPHSERSSDYDFGAHWRDLVTLGEKLGTCYTGYLANDLVRDDEWSRLRAWCHWDGQIGNGAGYSIGKWVAVHEVFRSLRRIATAFPFLTMRVQLLSETTGRPAYDFTVKAGTVLLADATEEQEPIPLNEVEPLTEERFTAAVARVLDKRSRAPLAEVPEIACAHCTGDESDGFTCPTCNRQLCMDCHRYPEIDPCPAVESVQQ